MAQQSENRKLSEEELFFYEDQMSAEADAVFRFCIALTLSQEQALKLLKSAYRRAATEIGSLMGLTESDLRTALFDCAFREAQNVSAAGQGDSPLFRFLKKLSLEQRAITVSREVCGLTPQQIAKVVGGSVDHILQQSAMTRKELHQHMDQAKPE